MMQHALQHLVFIWLPLVFAVHMQLTWLCLAQTHSNMDMTLQDPALELLSPPKTSDCWTNADNYRSQDRCQVFPAVVASCNLAVFRLEQVYEVEHDIVKSMRKLVNDAADAKSEKIRLKKEAGEASADKRQQPDKEEEGGTDDSSKISEEFNSRLNATVLLVQHRRKLEADARKRTGRHLLQNAIDVFQFVKRVVNVINPLLNEMHFDTRINALPAYRKLLQSTLQHVRNTVNCWPTKSGEGDLAAVYLLKLIETYQIPIKDLVESSSSSSASLFENTVTKLDADDLQKLINVGRKIEAFAAVESLTEFILSSEATLKQLEDSQTGMKKLRLVFVHGQSLYKAGKFDAALKFYEAVLNEAATHDESDKAKIREELDYVRHLAQNDAPDAKRQQRDSIKRMMAAECRRNLSSTVEIAPVESVNMHTCFHSGPGWYRHNMEILRFIPRIVKFHDVIGPKTQRRMLAFAKNQLLANLPTDQSRWESSWENENKHSTLKQLHDTMEMLTKFESDGVDIHDQEWTQQFDDKTVFTVDHAADDADDEDNNDDDDGEKPTVNARQEDADAYFQVANFGFDSDETELNNIVQRVEAHRNKLNPAGGQTGQPAGSSDATSKWLGTWMTSLQVGKLGATEVYTFHVNSKTAASQKQQKAAAAAAAGSAKKSGFDDEKYGLHHEFDRVVNMQTFSVNLEAGSAMFWLNSMRNGTTVEINHLMSCPNINGEKWQVNKWIRSELNVLQRPCSISKTVG